MDYVSKNSLRALISNVKSAMDEKADEESLNEIIVSINNLNNSVAVLETTSEAMIQRLSAIEDAFVFATTSDINGIFNN